MILPVPNVSGEHVPQDAQEVGAGKDNKDNFEDLVAENDPYHQLNGVSLLVHAALDVPL